MQRYTQRAGNRAVGAWVGCDKHTGDKYGTVVLRPLPDEAGDTDGSIVNASHPVNDEIEIG